MLHEGSIKIVAIIYGALIAFLCSVAFGLFIAAWARNPTRGTDPVPEAAPGPEPEPGPAGGFALRYPQLEFPGAFQRQSKS